MPSRLDVLYETVLELRDRRRKTLSHEAELQQRYRQETDRWQRKGGSSREMERCERKLKDIQYALNVKLPDAYGSAFRRWVIEYWTQRGRVELPYEVVNIVQECLGSRMVQRIEREVERELIKRGL